MAVEGGGDCFQGEKLTGRNVRKSMRGEIKYAGL